MISHRRYALKCLAFLAPIALLVVVLEVGLRHVTNSYNRKRALLSTQGPRATVLVLGASNAVMDVNPAFLSGDAFNLGNVSQTLYYDDQLLRRALDVAPRLRLALLVVTYGSLEASMADSPEYWRQYFYYRFWDVPLERDPGSLLDVRKVSLVALYSPATALGYALHGFHVDLTSDMDDDGWLHESPGEVAMLHATLTPQAGRQKVEQSAAYLHPERIPVNERYLADMIDRLGARGVRTVVVLPPVAHTLYDYIPRALRSEHAARMAAVSAAHGATYRDYLEDPRFGLDDFLDNDHLNSRGAERFSRLLDDDVVRPALAAPPR